MKQTLQLQIYLIQILKEQILIMLFGLMVVNVALDQLGNVKNNLIKKLFILKFFDRIHQFSQFFEEVYQ